MKNLSILKTVIWISIIFILCSIPGEKIPSTPLVKIPHFDKIVHFSIFFILGIFIMSNFKTYTKNRKTIASTVCMLIIFIYGGIIEILQSCYFENRSGDIYDLLSDTLGGLFAVISFDYIKKQKDLLLKRKPFCKIKFLKEIL